ncbi:hypothetical protein DFH08DRAFT_858080 [Mycena albidolilacea]|uniref:DUF6533 domain-containing protein n=1 Tax=Mycena albidolilacea TaxID=1033008 RepID=A0AAD7A8M4_9AGAR|nr:hypothetical protein DFH08DRAFT_858080 [Mycena albidolilacea]
MNSPDSESMGGLDYATFAWDHRVYRSMFLSGLAILVLDHILTFASEVQLMWRRPLRPSTCWFFAVRYFSLASSGVMAVFYFGDLSPQVGLCLCSKVERGLEALLMLQSTLVETTLCLRVLGMYGHTAWVKVSLGIGGAITAGLGLWTIIEYGDPQMMSAPGMTGCHTAIPRSTCISHLAIPATGLAGVWEAQLLLDLLVFGLTLYKAHADRAVMSLVPGSLVERMMRDGAIIVLANLADVLTLYIMIAGILSWWTTSLSITLISRLILNLQRAGGGNSAAMTNNYSTELESIHFVEQNRWPVRPVDDLASLFEDV